MLDRRRMLNEIASFITTIEAESSQAIIRRSGIKVRIFQRTALRLTISIKRESKFRRQSFKRTRRLKNYQDL